MAKLIIQFFIVGLLPLGGMAFLSLQLSEDALETGCDIIATACPFCMVMMTDGLKYKNKEEEIMNYDIAELVSQSLDLQGLKTLKV